MRCALTLALWSVLLCGATTARAQPLRRTAVIVGANTAAPGRKPLRYSDADARAFAEVLVELGGFAPQDVTLLLDPEPSAVLDALDRSLAVEARAGARERNDAAGADESMLVFYYSGHADAQALYPSGRPLSFADLRQRFGDHRAAIRLGIIDACRGGGWTGAKGLTEVEPFEVNLPMALESEGSILIASSSGLEDAHESELFGGSFFTHHWNAALRGAGDRNADGQVTLAEAFDYAKALTIRDTSLHTASAQHPSFSLNLRGRHDLALAQLETPGASGIVTVDQREGPLELIHLGSGVVVLELPKGARSLRLAVPPGNYLLRLARAGEVWTRELSVRAGVTTRVDEAALELQGNRILAVKRSAPRPLTLTTLPRGAQEATFWFGVSHARDPNGAEVGRGIITNAIVPRGLTDRLQWILPNLAFAYRFGDYGGLEWVPWAGTASWGMGVSSLEGFILRVQLGAGLAVRKWVSARGAFTLTLGTGSILRWHARETHWTDADGMEQQTPPKLVAPTTWRSGLSLGFMHTLADAVTLHFSLSLSQNLTYEGEFGPFKAHSPRGALALGLGAVQWVGLRPQHLVQVHLRDYCALNFDAALQYSFVKRSLDESYLIGASFLW